MPDVKMSAALPEGDRNGLSRIASQLVGEPEQPHVAIVLLDAVRLTTDVDTHSVQPTVRIQAIEPIPVGDDAKELQRLLRRAYESRTGKVELPLELERALDGLIPPGAEDDPGWDDDPQIPGPGPQPNPGDLPPEDPGGTTFEAGGSDPS
jgi:hypothetical protein